MPAAAHNLYTFEDFRLDENKRILLRHREPVPLPGKAFDTLLILVHNRERLMTKKELMDAVWPNSFVEESNLTQTVFLLRKALGETREKRYVVTYPGRGYRFVAAVKEDSAQPHETPRAVFSAQGSARPANARSFPPRWSVVATVSIVLAAGAFLWSRRDPPASRPMGKLTLAVLPFENLTGDSAQDYFSDGLTEEMISQLGALDPEHLAVIARTSVMNYKNARVPFGRIRRELGAQYVLEGSVRRDGDQIRISAQLIRADDQTHLWARQYDRQLSGLLAVQGEIAQAVSDEIELTLGKNRRVASMNQPLSKNWFEAYDLYLKGRYYWNKRTPEGFDQAISSFRQALEKDSNFARAYAGLADAYALQTSYGLGPRDELIAKARAAALKALELDPKLAEAYAPLALISSKYDYDWKQSERLFRRAIELDPNYATAHHWYAELLGSEARWDEAAAEFERARRLDPLSLIIATDRGAMLLSAGQYDRAIEQFQAVLAVDRNFPRANIIISAYAANGMFKEALSEIYRHRKTDADPAWTWRMEAEVLFQMGRREQARKAFLKALRLNPSWDEKSRKCHAAWIGFSNKADLFPCLEDDYQHHIDLSGLKTNHAYDSLRGDPRFQDLIHRVGLD